MVKLYRAYTVRQNYKSRDAVIVDWYRPERSAPVAPREGIISNYPDMNEEEKKSAGRKVDHFLTGDEVEKLSRALMARTGFEVKTKELEIPFPDGRKIPDYTRPQSPDDECEYYHMDGDEDGGPGFPVSGFCDLSEPPNLVSNR